MSKFMDIKNLNKSELENLLSSLNLYLDLSKKLWKRGKEIFKRNLSWESEFLVEYFPSISEDTAYENSLEVYSKVFSIKPSRKSIRFEARDSLLGWIKVYKDDMLVDLSFSKVEKMLKQ